MDNESNPWKTQGSKIVYDNPWITVAEDQVLNPAGKPGIYGNVHFKNRAVGIIPLDSEQNTWLVGQYRYTLNEYFWEIPMGGVLYSEDLLTGAQRELQEETGITAASWKQILTIHTSNCVTDEVGYVYLAQDLAFGDPQFDDTEELTIRKLPFPEVLGMVLDGTITDAISMAAILKLDRTINSLTHVNR